MTTPTPPAKRYTIEQNSDGSAIVKLAEPVRFGKEALSRLTIPRLTGRHMRHADWTPGANISVGTLVAFAAQVIEPLGAVDELDAVIARDLAHEVILHLGKASRATGEAPSPT